MPLPLRVLKATLKLPNNQDVILDESLEMNVKISKNCIRQMATAEIEVFNLTTTQRTNLLSQFTEWNARLVQTGAGGTETAYLNCFITAGYNTNGGAGISTLFTGQIVRAQLSSSPPNQGVKIFCAARQVDRTKDSVIPPSSATFKEYVAWAANVMGVRYECQTSYDNQRVSNAFAAISDVIQLIWELAAMFAPHVVAYFDNNVLYVRDINKSLEPGQITPITEFIGAPSLSSFGATFTTLLDTRVRLGGLVHLQSKMNPVLANGKPFLVFKMDYSLSSRSNDFYQQVEAYPSGD